MSIPKFSLLLFSLFFFYTSSTPVCSDAPSSPTKAEDCIDFSSPELSCCFAEIEVSDGNTVNKCVGVKPKHTFALGFLRGINIEGYQNVNANFTCGQKDKICGTDNPSFLFQCREHSSEKKSCCMLIDGNGKTNCILTQEKYQNETTFILFETNQITCNGFNMKLDFMFLLLVFLMLM